MPDEVAPVDPLPGFVVLESGMRSDRLESLHHLFWRIASTITVHFCVTTFTALLHGVCTALPGFCSSRQ